VLKSIVLSGDNFNTVVGWLSGVLIQTRSKSLKLSKGCNFEDQRKCLSSCCTRGFITSPRVETRGQSSDVVGEKRDTQILVNLPATEVPSVNDANQPPTRLLCVFCLSSFSFSVCRCGFQAVLRTRPSSVTQDPGSCQTSTFYTSPSTPTNPL
jgi:hypothetical protein